MTTKLPTCQHRPHLIFKHEINQLSVGSNSSHPQLSATTKQAILIEIPAGCTASKDIMWLLVKVDKSSEPACCTNTLSNSLHRCCWCVPHIRLPKLTLLRSQTRTLEARGPG